MRNGWGLGHNSCGTSHELNGRKSPLATALPAIPSARPDSGRKIMWRLPDLDVEVEEVEDHGLVRAEGLAGADVGEERIADLASSAGDAHADRSLRHFAAAKSRVQRHTPDHHTPHSPRTPWHEAQIRGLSRVASPSSHSRGAPAAPPKITGQVQGQLGGPFARCTEGGAPRGAGGRRGGSCTCWEG